MNTKKLFGVTAFAASMIITGTAWAECGALPTPPALPADGAAVSSKDMEKVAQEFDAYQTKFVEVNDCATKEYNETADKFKAVMEAYAAKNKKK